MAAASRASARKALGVEDRVLDDEVDEAIALFGGDPREAVRALVGALHHLVSRGYARGQLSIVPPPLHDGLEKKEAPGIGRRPGPRTRCFVRSPSDCS